MARRRLRSQRQTLRLITLGVGVLLGIGALIGLGILSWQPYVRISEIGVQGTEIISPDQVTANVAATLSGKTLLFPKDSIALYSSRTIEDNLKQAFPALKEARTSRASLTSITVSVTERTRAFTWCGESHASTSPCFIGDVQGFLFKTSDASARSLPQVYGPLAEKKEPLRNYVYRAGSVESVLALDRTLEEGGIEITYTEMLPEDEVHLTLASGPVVYYVLGRESHIAQTLPTLLEEVTKGDAAPIEYIDMRFGNRVYVKRRE